MNADEMIEQLLRIPEEWRKREVYFVPSQGLWYAQPVESISVSNERVEIE